MSHKKYLHLNFKSTIFIKQNGATYLWVGDIYCATGESTSSSGKQASKMVNLCSLIPRNL